MRKGGKRKANQREEAKPENNNKECSSKATIRLPKRVKANHPQSDPEYLEDPRNLQDLWKAAFPVGTEWDQLDSVYKYKWDFSNLEQEFEEGGKLYGIGNNKVYIFVCTEPLSPSDPSLVPVLVAVVSPFPPSDRIAVTSVQSATEETIPMKQMKMDWIPYIPLENRGSQVDRLRPQIFVLGCTQRRAALKHLKIDRVKKFDYCLPYLMKMQEDEVEPSTEVDIFFPAEPNPPVVCEFDWEFHELEEFTDERIIDKELPADQKDAFMEFIRDCPSTAEHCRALPSCAENCRRRPSRLITRGIPRTYEAPYQTVDTCSCNTRINPLNHNPSYEPFCNPADNTRQIQAYGAPNCGQRRISPTT